MNRVDWNIPDAPYFTVGKYIPGANNYLDSPPEASGTVPSDWVPQLETDIEFLGAEHWHHVHYLAAESIPSIEELEHAPYLMSFDNELAILLPEGIFNVYFLQHTETHLRKGYDTDIGVIGPFKVDATPPVVSLQVANGVYRVESANTSANIDAADQFGNLQDMFIDGDIRNGVNIRTWIPIDTSVNLVLDDTKLGRKFVTVRVRDTAGNVSALAVDDVFLGDTKYYFYHVNGVANKLLSAGSNFAVATNNRFLIDGSKNMTTGEEHGKFGSH